METETDLAAEAEGSEAEPSAPEVDQSHIDVSYPTANLELPPDQQQSIMGGEQDGGLHIEG